VTGLTIGVELAEGHVNHQFKFFEQVAQLELQAPLLEVLTQLPLVITVFLPHSATQYPFSK